MTSRFWGDRRGPWFRWHPAAAVLVAAGLFAGVFGVRLLVADQHEPVSVLYVLPIALLAVAFGLRGGIAGATTGVLLLWGWAAVENASLSLVGWASRVTAMALLGVLLGAAVDRLAEASRVERLLLAARLREREAAEISDSIIQGMAAAKWLLESGRLADSERVLTQTIEASQELVVGLLHDSQDASRLVVSRSLLS